MKQISLFFLTLLFSVNLNAVIKISGRIIDSSNTDPIEFASISLVSKDSTLIIEAQSDKNGKFIILDKDGLGSFVHIKYVGYNGNIIRIDNLQTNIELGDVDLMRVDYGINEITVTSNRTIYKVDRQIIYPSQMEVKMSTNGFDLLDKMPISGLRINSIEKTLAIQGQDVQLRINGIKSTIQEFIALLPKNISKVEYFQDPGVRFGNENVGAVINVITTQEKTTGGYISFNGFNSPVRSFGEDQISLKMNDKASQFAFDYEIRYRSLEDRFTDATNIYRFSENEFTKTQKGEKRPKDIQIQNISLSYNLSQPQKYVFNVSFRDNLYNAQTRSSDNNYYSNNNITTLTDKKIHERRNTPSLDFYYRQELKNKQSLMFNIVGTYIKTKDVNSYTEIVNKNLLDSASNDLHTQKYSIISEISYNKQFEKVSLTLGGKHTQSHSKNMNNILSSSKNRLNQSDSYAYIQIQGKINKINYSLGIAGSRIGLKDNNKEKTYYSYLPSLQLSYHVNNDLNIRYFFKKTKDIPTLSQTSDIEQKIDRYTIFKGNQNLNPYDSYRNQINASFKKGILSIDLYTYYLYLHKPFMRVDEISDNNLIQTFGNYKSFNKFASDIELTIRIIKNIWTVSIWGGIDSHKARRDENTYNYTNKYVGVKTNVAYKNFTFSSELSTRINNLWGETINYASRWSYFELGYKLKKVQIRMTFANPFEKYYSIGTKSLSRDAPSKSWLHIGDYTKLFYLGVSWNMSFGKKHSAGSKKLQNLDSEATKKFSD